MGTLRVKMPSKLKEMISSKARYKVLYGGRGSGKSWFFSDLAVIKGYEEKLFIPCLRQYQSSMKDSVHRLLSNSIKKFNLEEFYSIQDNKITGANGTEFIFIGLARNINNIKSLEGADIAWVTEAVDVSEEAWKKLIPTIRKEDLKTGKESQIWVDFNPENEDDPTYKRFVLNPPTDSLVIKINYQDNPFFPNVLKKEMEHDRKYNEEEYNNIWLGECSKTSDAQIMKNKWEIKEFPTPSDVYFYYGADWGNSGLGDPDTIIRCFIKDGSIYIDHEAKDQIMYIEDYVDFYDSMEGTRNYKIKCDNTMAKFRRHLNSAGFRLEDAKKGAGSVEKGLKHIRSYKRIYIHPRCKQTIFEFKHYKYKVDPRTGEVTKIIIDKHNHMVDSLRYALEDVMRENKGSVIRTGGW